MKKALRFVCVLFAGAASLQAQLPNATDFRIKDCKNIEHSLFSELDSGKVIVLSWVMPCGVCINPASSASTAAKSFNDSYPGRVRFYLADDYGNTSCSSLEGWMKSFQITADAVFSNNGIKMADYGDDGMPKTVVIAGSKHEVFFNVNSGFEYADLKNAIQLAVDASLNTENLNSTMGLQLYPNPAVGIAKLTLPNGLAFESVQIWDLSGKLVWELKTGSMAVMNGEININTDGIQPGIYHVKVKTPNKILTSSLLIE